MTVRTIRYTALRNCSLVRPLSDPDVIYVVSNICVLVVQRRLHMTALDVPHLSHIRAHDITEVYLYRDSRRRVRELSRSGMKRITTD